MHKIFLMVEKNDNEDITIRYIRFSNLCVRGKVSEIWRHQILSVYHYNLHDKQNCI